LADQLKALTRRVRGGFRRDPLVGEGAPFI
jgi:hypothetical protein